MSLYDLDGMGGMGGAREVDRKPLGPGESTLATCTGVHQDGVHIFVRMGTGGLRVPLSPGSVAPEVGADVLLVGTRRGLVAVYFPAAREVAWNMIMPVSTPQVQPAKLLGVRCRITGWELEGDVSGSIVVEIRKNDRAGTAITGTGAQRPAIVGGVSAAGLPGSEWLPVIEMWDKLYFVIISSTTITQVHIGLKAVRI
jgi:hypothetical protein